MLTLLLLFLVASGIVAWLFIGHEHKGMIALPLPDEFGGTVPVWASVDWKVTVENAELSLISEATLSIDEETFDTILPKKEYSMLVNETDSPHVASMLGRFVFQDQSAQFEGEGGNISISAGMSGEFLVRERRRYGIDEEQPSAGVLLPFKGIITANFNAISFDRKWQLQTKSRNVNFELEKETRLNWKDLYGEGNHLADLVEKIVTERANALFAQIETDSSELRSLTKDKIFKNATENGKLALQFIRIALTVDNCPIVEAREIFFSISGRAIITDEVSEFELPDLAIRNGPCT